MKRELILHIGTTKTGSTSIQHTLARNRAALTAQGICYPVSPGDPQHRLLAVAMMSNLATRDRLEPTLWRGMAPAARIEQFLSEFADEMRALPPSIKKVIISTEFIYILLRKPEEVRRVHALLAPWFDSIKVVIYLRRQDAHFTSLYTQILRTGEVIAPEQLKMRARPMHELDYAELLDRWAEVFGSANIVPRLFEKVAGRRFDTVADFFDLCGISLPNAGDAPRESNQSVDLAGQRLLVDLGRLIQAERKVKKIGGPAWRSLTEAITSVSPGRGWQPTREKAREFLGLFTASNEQVRSTWFPTRRALFDDDFTDYPENPPQASPEALYQAACRTILYISNRERARGLKSAQEGVREAERAGNKRRLRTALLRVIRLDVESVEHRLALAALHIDEGDLHAARGLVDAALALESDDTAAQEMDTRLRALEGTPAKPRAEAQPVHTKPQAGSARRGRHEGRAERPVRA